MDYRKSDDFFSFVYEPSILGYSERFFKTLAGFPVLTSNGNLNLNEVILQTRPKFLGGNLAYNLTVPSAPSGGDDKEFGVREVIGDSEEVAYFQISGSDFRVVSGDQEGNTESSTLDWEASWTSTETRFEIDFQRDGVAFLVNGRKLAVHTSNYPSKRPQPGYIKNNNADNTILHSLVVDEMEKRQEAHLPVGEISSTLIDIQAGSANNQTYNAYINMDEIENMSLQFETTPSGATTKLEIYGTLEQDGSQPSNRTYQEVTQGLFGNTDYTDDAFLIIDTDVTFSVLNPRITVTNAQSGTTFTLTEKHKLE